MPVKWVREIATGRTGSDSNSLDVTARRVFQVEMESLSDPQEEVLAVDNIPAIYSPYISTIDNVARVMWCHDRKTNVEPNSKIWIVTCDYSTKLDRPDLQNQVLPDQRPSEIEFDAISVNIPVVEDINGLAILNSAGDLFDPPLETEETRMLIRITRNFHFAGFDPGTGASFKNKVNSNGGWLGLKKWQAKCRSYRAVRFFEAADYWYRVTAEFEVGYRSPPTNVVWPNGEAMEENAEQSLTWIKYVLDRGFREIPKVPRTGAGLLVPILDPFHMMPLSTAGLLDGDGERLLPGASPVFLAFDIYGEADFDDLNLIQESTEFP